MSGWHRASRTQLLRAAHILIKLAERGTVLIHADPGLARKCVWVNVCGQVSGWQITSASREQILRTNQYF